MYRKIREPRGTGREITENTNKRVQRVQETANQMNEGIAERFKYLRTITEPCVWTDRMLTTLITGVKRGKWYSLMDKLTSEENITKSAEKVIANKGAPGIDNVTTEVYQSNIEHYNKTLLNELKTGTYKPRPVKRVYIPKAGTNEKRPLGIPTVRDRVVQKALKETIEVIFENEFSKSSYGFRPQRGCKDALREVNKLLKEGYLFVLDADIKGYFDSISHARLIKLMEEKISDSRIIELIRSFLKQGVMEEMNYSPNEQGTPQGGIISPLLANIYLDGLDKQMESKGYKMIRYADDFIILSRSMNEAENILKEVTIWMSEATLTLNSEKTKIVNMADEGASFNFLGYTFKRNKAKLIRFPSRKSMTKFKDKIRILTRRCNGKSLIRIIEEIKPISRGWFEYYKHSIKYTFMNIDSWCRMRLRSILKKRHGKRGVGRNCNDHKRWNNEFFEEMGFYSLEKAYNFYSQPISSNS